MSEDFDVRTGVLQGDPLAPFLFIIVMDYVLKEKEHYFRIYYQWANVLESTFEKCQQLFSILSNKAKSIGLEINVKKTEALTNQNHQTNYVTLDNEKIQWVDNFKYLGSMVLSSETDIRIFSAQRPYQSTSRFKFLALHVSRSYCMDAKAGQ